jgi:hypothetical protein
MRNIADENVNKFAYRITDVAHVVLLNFETFVFGISELIYEGVLNGWNMLAETEMFLITASTSYF